MTQSRRARHLRRRGFVQAAGAAAALAGTIGAVGTPIGTNPPGDQLGPGLAERIASVQKQAKALGFPNRTPEAAAPGVAQWYNWQDWQNG